MRKRLEGSARGFALLTVLGALVVLSAVALALSSSVRTEMGAAANRADDLRAYYLAQAGVQEGLYLLAYAPTADTPTLRRLHAAVGPQGFVFELGEGRARVEIRSEAGKIDINHADEELLVRLLRQLAVAPDPARALAQAIVHWRTPRTEQTEDALDRYYRGLPQPYAARHAPFTTVEELLLVRGMTREILYGQYALNEEGGIILRGGLIRHVTVRNPSGLIDANSASYEVLRALEVSEFGARSLLAARNAKPLTSLADLQSALPAEIGGSRLTVATGDVLELAATGEPAGSRVRHTLRALVKFDPMGPRPYRILAWYDQSSDWPAPEEVR